MKHAEGDKKCIPNFNQKTRGMKTIWKSQTRMGEYSSGSINGGKFIDQLTNYQFHKMTGFS
jgi:hypothetical protein